MTQHNSVDEGLEEWHEVPGVLRLLLPLVVFIAILQDKAVLHGDEMEAIFWAGNCYFIEVLRLPVPFKPVLEGFLLAISFFVVDSFLELLI